MYKLKNYLNSIAIFFNDYITEKFSGVGFFNIKSNF